MKYLLGISIVATAIGLAVLSGGCASSALVNVWHDPAFQAPTLGKVLVIAVRKDATKRRIWEDAFANELAKHGVDATSSYSLFLAAPPDTDQVIQAVKGYGFDGVMVILKLPTETDIQYVRGYTTVEQNFHYGSYWGRYWTYYSEIDHPGYVDTQTVSIRSIDVTETRNGGRLIWSGTSRTLDPKTVTGVQQTVSGLVVDDLAKQKIVSAKK